MNVHDGEEGAGGLGSRERGWDGERERKVAPEEATGGSKASGREGEGAENGREWRAGGRERERKG